MGGIGLPEGWAVEWLELVDSTNEWLKRREACHGQVVVAERQTSGRGRRGAVWHAAPGENLTFSVFLKPSEPRGLWPRLALATGLAISEGLGRLGVEAGVKWPNDVWVNQRKLAGILVEATNDGAIIGVGLNVQTTGFPDEIAATATSLAMETGNPFEVSEVLDMLLGPLSVRCSQIGGEFDEVLCGLRERCVLTGSRIKLLAADGPLEGVGRGIGDQGELLLETKSGLKRLIQADEVRLLD